jgi:hypothetical protein
MKRLIIPLLLAALATGMPGCQKTSNQSDPTGPGLIPAARTYFEQQWEHAPPAATTPNPRNNSPRTPDWANARIVSLPNTEAVVVPVHYSKPFYLGTSFGGIRQYLVDDLTQLIIYKDSARAFHAEMLTALPDSNFKGRQIAPVPNAPFTGMLLVDQWDGQPLARYKYDNHPPRVWRPGGPSENANGTKRLPEDYLLQTCYELVGYNYPANDPNAGIPWQEDLGCTTSFIAAVPSTQLLDAAAYMTVAGGGGVGPLSHLNPLYPGDGGIVDGTMLKFNFDDQPGIDLTKAFKCFTYIPDQGATYSVTLCADIPVDNNSGALVSTSLHPGHAFLILTKTNGITSLSQSFGFYPDNSVISIGGQYMMSKIKDDGAVSHEYDASLTMPNISQLDFQTVENEAVNLANSQQYSLYNYNCTNYALQVYNSIRVNAPITVPDWIGSFTGINFGSTPNALYESLVGMKTFFPGASNPNVSIGPKYAPASAGACN